MILYCDTVKRFIEECEGENPVIVKELLSKFEEHHLGGGSESERRSWLHSLPKVASALKDKRIPKDANVGLEYKLIDTRQRVDFLIYGKDEEDKENVVLVELKQWSEAKHSNLKNYVKTEGGHGEDDYWHPSYQAYNYANIMRMFNEYVYEYGVKVNACSYLHNMPEGYSSFLNDEKEYPLVREAPSFLKDDEQKLASFIARYVKKSYPITLYKIDESRICPSAAFGKMVLDAVNGEPFFSYDKEQAYSVAKIVSEVNEALEKGERRTLIIKGGPGSGKSIVAINALGQLLHPSDLSQGKNACYVTANFTPRTYFGDVLSEGDFKKKAIKELFKTPASFARSSAYDFDCVIVDEAHRMLKWKFGWGLGREVDVIDKLFNASRVNVFLIDEDQVVTKDDDLSIAEIRKYAERYGSTVIEDDRMILSSQFRCVGGESYIAFVNKLLGYSNEFVSLKGMKYDLRIMDSMSMMMKEWEKKNDGAHELRLIAGYTHDWVSQYDKDAYDFVYDGGKVKLRWNVKKADRAAILDHEQTKNVFCIHTIQGLEVEYAGVILGKDITYNEKSGKIEYHPEENASTDNGSGIRRADKDLAERLIRNTYKVLFTRGVRGTYIYAEDKALNEYLKKIVKY